MLNLFKLLFFGERRNTPDGFPCHDVALSILRNYFSRHPNLTDDKRKAVYDLMATEMRTLRKALRKAEEKEHYDLIRHTLSKLEEKLRGIRN